MKNNQLIIGNRKKGIFIISLLALYFVSLFLPFIIIKPSGTDSQMYIHNISGWQTLLGSLSRPKTPFGGWYDYYKSDFAFSFFLFFLVLYFVFRRWNKSFFLAIAVLLSTIYLAIYLLVALFVGVDNLSLAIQPLGILYAWGYYVSTSLSFVIAFWVLRDGYRNRNMQKLPALRLRSKQL